MVEKVEREKLGIGAKPRKRSIRPGTDGTRRPEASVRSAAWERDGGRCGFVSEDGRRCTERVFLEFHHLHAYAQGGKRTLENIRLRCRRHNQYEAELVFGPRDAAIVREGQGEGFVQSG